MEAKDFRGDPDYTDFILHLADTDLILAQRLCEWCGHGPVLEQDIAMSNIALDLLGRASNYYAYAAELKGKGETADSLAMLRSEREYKNLLLVELPNGHFGHTVARQFFYDAFQTLFLQQLQEETPDTNLRAIAEKSLKETKYHFRWSSEWMIRLGDGTEESHSRMQEALGATLPYVGEAFLMTDYQETLISKALVPDPRAFRAVWQENVDKVLHEAGLPVDWPGVFVQKGGKQGVHTEQLGYILSDLQYMQRVYPGQEW